MIVVAKQPQISQAKVQARRDRNLFDPALSGEEIRAAFKQAHKVKSLLPANKKVTLHASPFLSCVQTAACFAKVFSHENSSSTSLDLYLHNELSDSWASLTGDRPFPRPKGLSSLIPLLQINTLSRDDFKQLYIGKRSKLTLDIHYNSATEHPSLLQSAADRRSRLLRSFAATMHGVHSINQNEIVIVISHACALSAFLEIFKESREGEERGECSFAIAKTLGQKTAPTSQRVLPINDHQGIKKIKEDQNCTEQKGHQNEGPRWKLLRETTCKAKPQFCQIQHSDDIEHPIQDTQDHKIIQKQSLQRGYSLCVNILNQRALGAISSKHKSSLQQPGLFKSVSCSSLPRRPDLKEKIALSKQSVFLSKRALSKKLRTTPLKLAGSPALPNLLTQTCKLSALLLKSSENIKQEKCLVRSAVTRPILRVRSNGNCVSKITGASSGDAEGNAKEEGAKFYKRWGIFHREDWEKA